ncbi:hypothetical protein QQZ08_001219 [Neonectria magnoliae]|uniref:HpcH/HpaI aldolase/citrate lyase domain-containing protein n=1 Tax=Neonectria magnoliae TaxID=2732573 RepID=A0ABR1IH17_9HYPO
MSSSSRSPKEVAVRINAVDTGLALEDLTELLKRGDNIDAIVVPKVQGPEDLHFVADIVRHVAPHRAVRVNGTVSGIPNSPRPLNILALIESARGLSDITSICRAAPTTGLSGLAFAAEDFATQLGLSRLPDRRGLLFDHSSILTAALAHSLPSVIDLVSAGVPSDDASRAALAQDCHEVMRLASRGGSVFIHLKLGLFRKPLGRRQIV